MLSLSNAARLLAFPKKSERLGPESSDLAAFYAKKEYQDSSPAGYSIMMYLAGFRSGAKSD